MKKTLITTVLGLAMSSSAFAGKITQADASNKVAQTELTYSLAVDGGYVFKLLAGKQAAVPADANGIVDHKQTVVDLGTVTGNVMGASSCGDIVGLAKVADLGIVANEDADTKVTPAQASASCSLSKDSSTQSASITLEIPIAAVWAVSGTSKVDIVYAVENETGKEFQTASLSSDDGLSRVGIGGFGSQGLKLTLNAVLVGAAAKSDYAATVKATVTEQ